MSTIAPPAPTIPHVHLNDAWLDAKGNLYEVGECGHHTWMYEYYPHLHNPKEQEGWVKVSYRMVYCHNNEMTQAQLDALFDLKQVNPRIVFDPRHYTIK